MSNTHFKNVVREQANLLGSRTEQLERNKTALSKLKADVAPDPKLVELVSKVQSLLDDHCKSLVDVSQYCKERIESGDPKKG